MDLISSLRSANAAAIASLALGGMMVGGRGREGNGVG